MVEEREVYVRKKRPFNMVEETDGVLEEINKMAHQLDMTCFLWGGTCLGFVRDGTYLRGDVDLDLGFWCTDEQRKRFTMLLLNSDYTALGKSTKRYVKGDVWLDFYFPGDLRLGEHAKYTRQLGHVHYKARVYRVPFPVDGYLADAYGPDWQTKKTYFIERFPLPREVEDKRVFVVIGGERQEFLFLDKNLEIVELKKLHIKEDSR